MSLMESKASAAICVHLNVSVLQDGNCNSAGPRDEASSTSKKKATAAPPLTSKRMCSGLYILHENSNMQHIYIMVQIRLTI